MDKEQAEEVLESIGFEQILEDHNLNELEVLLILDELKFIDLEGYLE
jgi:hypothetical protein